MLEPFHGLFTAIKQSGNVPLKNKHEQNYFSKKNCLLSRKKYYFGLKLLNWYLIFHDVLVGLQELKWNLKARQITKKINFPCWSVRVCHRPAKNLSKAPIPKAGYKKLCSPVLGLSMGQGVLRWPLFLAELKSSPND